MMAEVAIGKPCPSCGTFTAYSGSRSDEHLTAQCACCQRGISIPNPEYVESPERTAWIATEKKNVELVEENARLTAEVASLKTELAEYAKPAGASEPPAPNPFDPAATGASSPTA
jgi:hypothetical protein